MMSYSHYHTPYCHTLYGVWLESLPECLPGMLCAEITQPFRGLVAGGFIYYVGYGVSVDVHYVDIDRIVEDGVLVCS